MTSLEHSLILEATLVIFLVYYTGIKANDPHLKPLIETIENLGDVL